MKTETWVRLAAIGVCVVIAALIGCVIVSRFLGILLPFGLAALVASVLRPAALFLKKRCFLPEKVGGTLLILTAVTLLSFGIVSLGRLFYDGARELIAALPAMLADEDNPLRRLIDLIERFSGSAGETAGDWEALYGMLSGMVQKAVSTASAALTSGATSVIMGLPRVILSLVVGVVALFYLFFDREKLSAQLRFFCSEKTLRRLSALLTHMRRAVGGFFRAYLSLLLLTFAELLAGFLILNIRRPLTVAAVTAMVDLLPVLGVGTVLIPWSVFSFLSGDIFRGVGLLVLFGVMYVVRQFAEPRLLGSTMGIHPLFTLFAVFAGFSLFGILGLFAAPLLLYTAKALLTALTDQKE